MTDYQKIMAIQLNGILAGIAGLVVYQLNNNKKDLKKAIKAMELVVEQLNEIKE